MWLCVVAGVGHASIAAGAERPNVVLIVADDLGYADVGFHGGRDVPTPHLDALAKAGVRCTSGYVSGPYCSPTRAGLLTGRYQQRFGHEFNPSESRPGQAFGMPVDQTTIAQRMKAAGYVTGLVGKWHLGDAPQFRPNRRGFDEFFGFLGGAHTYFAGKTRNIYRNDAVGTEDEYLTDAFAREAVAFVERHKARPFFLELAFNAVHTPMDATPARLERFASISDPRRRSYAAMLSALDEGVGRLMDALRAADLERNTLVIFFSDNGGPTMVGTSVNGSRNDPLRGSKRTTLEGGIRVPFVLSWPGVLPAGKQYDAPVIQLDILPTALAAAGAPLDPGAKLDGVNLLPYLKGEAKGIPHEALYWRLGPQAAIRRGDWKLVRHDLNADAPQPRTKGAGAANRARPPISPWRLYNLASDIGESRPVNDAHPERVKQLTEAWEAWSRELAEPLWGGGPAQAAGK